MYLQIPGRPAERVLDVRLDDLAGRIFVVSQLGELPEKSLGELLSAVPRSDSPDRASLESLLDLVGLAKPLDACAGHLSGGERQRFKTARLLRSPAKVWVLDEAFSALDIPSAETLTCLLLARAKDCGATLLFVTHNQKLETLFDSKLILTRSTVAEALVEVKLQGSGGD